MKGIFIYSNTRNVDTKEIFREQSSLLFLFLRLLLGGTPISWPVSETLTLLGERERKREGKPASPNLLGNVPPGINEQG